MIKRSIMALSLGLALFSCQKKNQEPEAPTGWQIFETPTEASFRGLSPVTGDIAWVSGSGGTWMKTLDGGATWSYGVIAGLDSVDFRSIQGFDAETAVAVSAGQPAVIYKTTNGGETWELKHQEVEEAFLDGITFSDENRGYVFGDPVDGKWMILQTLDQGESWTPIDSLPQAANGEAGFAASASSLLAEGENLYLGSGGTEASLHISTDQGKTWSRYPSPLIQGKASQGIFALTSTRNGELILVGGDYVAPEETQKNAGIFRTTDNQWIEYQSGPLGYRSGVQYFPRFNWVITVGTNGSDYSNDYGLTWSSFSQEDFHAVKLSLTEGTIWASGGKGKVAKLTF